MRSCWTGRPGSLSLSAVQDIRDPAVPAGCAVEVSLVKISGQPLTVRVRVEPDVCVRDHLRGGAAGDKVRRAAAAVLDVVAGRLGRDRGPEDQRVCGRKRADGAYGLVPARVGRDRLPAVEEAHFKEVPKPTSLDSSGEPFHDRALQQVRNAQLRVDPLPEAGDDARLEQVLLQQSIEL